MPIQLQSFVEDADSLCRKYIRISIIVIRIIPVNMRFSITATTLVAAAILPQLVVGHLEKRQSCAPDYTLCRPDGVSERGPRTSPNDLASLYLNLLDAIKSLPPNSWRKRDLSPLKTKRLAQSAQTGDGAQVCCTFEQEVIFVAPSNGLTEQRTDSQLPQ